MSATWAVTGGRNFSLTHSCLSTLRRLLLQFKVSELRHGDCRGADRDAARCASALGVEVVPYPADWNRYGKAAGPIRNGEMLTGVDRLIAFPGGSGTDNCVRQALGRDIPVDCMLKDGHLMRHGTWSLPAEEAMGDG